MKVLFNKEVIIIDEAPPQEELLVVRKTETAGVVVDEKIAVEDNQNSNRESTSSHNDDESDESETQNEEDEEIVIPRITGDSTIGDLRKYLSIRCGIPLLPLDDSAASSSGAVTWTIRLIHHGKMLSNDAQRINDLPGGIAMVTLNMLATSKEEIKKLQEKLEKGLKEQKLIRDDFQKKKKRKTKKSSDAEALAMRREEALRTYGFRSIEQLPNLPFQTKAYDILHTLATDPGILAVMKHYNWLVPTLGELYPEGHVGVSDVCILGLNVNQGMKILLRIRTDDLQGFRKIDIIKETLYHELAHNRLKEHNAEFFAFTSLIKKQALASDWRRQGDSIFDRRIGGRKVGNFGRGEFYRGDDDDDEEEEEEEETVHRLGGESDLIAKILPAELLARDAALKRAREAELASKGQTEVAGTEEVMTIEESGEEHITDRLQAVVIPVDTTVEKVAIDVNEGVNVVHVENEGSSSVTEMEVTSAIESYNTAASVSHTDVIVDVITPVIVTDPPQEEVVPVVDMRLRLQQSQEELNAKLDESLALMMSSDSLSSAYEKLLQLRHSVLDAIYDRLLQVYDVKNHEKFDEVKKAIEVLVKIVSNAKTGEAKFLKVKQSSNLLQKAFQALGSQLGDDLLTIAGFQLSVIPTPGTGEQVVYYEFKRKDIAMLCIVQEILEAIGCHF